MVRHLLDAKDLKYGTKYLRISQWQTQVKKTSSHSSHIVACTSLFMPKTKAGKLSVLMQYSCIKPDQSSALSKASKEILMMHIFIPTPSLFCNREYIPRK